MIICWWCILVEAVKEMVDWFRSSTMHTHYCKIWHFKKTLYKTSAYKLNKGKERLMSKLMLYNYTFIINHLPSFWNKITKWPNLVVYGGCAHRWRTLINLVLRWNLQFSISVSFLSVVNARVLVVIFLLTSPLPSLLAVIWQSVFL